MTDDVSIRYYGRSIDVAAANFQCYCLGGALHACIAVQALFSAMNGLLCSHSHFTGGDDSGVVFMR